MKLKPLFSKIVNSKTIFFVVLVSLVVSAAFTIVRLVTLYGSDEEVYEWIWNDYVLTLLQCVVGSVVLFVPSFLERKLKARIPSSMIIAYALLLFCGIFLGEVRSFYFRIPHWDKILHGLSGAMLGALGFTLISYLNKDRRIPVAMSPAFVAVFIFCFATTMGVLWEVYEFAIDQFFGTNMQKFEQQNGVDLVGRYALMDTMHDFIVNLIGAGVFSVIGYFALKQNKDWPNKLLLQSQVEDSGSVQGREQVRVRGKAKVAKTATSKKSASKRTKK